VSLKTAFLSQPHGASVGWVHDLAFDLFVGARYGLARGLGGRGAGLEESAA
jgi:hypothetical protein